MKITLATPVKELKFTPQVEQFWNEQLVKSKTARSGFYSDKIPKWETIVPQAHITIVPQIRIVELFEHISTFHRAETYELKNKTNNPDFNPSNYLSVQMLDILNKEGLSITKVFLDTQSDDPQNSNGWAYADFFDLYLKYLEFKNELVPNSLLTQFTSEIEEGKKQYYHRALEEDVATYFQLLKVIPQNKITYEWFSENLNLFCLKIDEDSDELVNECKSLNYDLKKQIFDYVSKNFPEHLTEKSEYYADLLPGEVFSTKRLYQGSVDVNLFQIMQQQQLKQKDFYHLSNIAKECLNVVSKPEFMKLINENIPVSNIHAKESNSKITLNFSTDSYENLETFEKIIVTALTGVLEVPKKIRLEWTEAFSGENELITNMDAKFIHQHYLFHNLNNTLEESNAKPKKPKI